MKITDDLLKELSREKYSMYNSDTGEVIEDVYRIHDNFVMGKDEAHKAAARNRIIAARQHQVELVTAVRADDEHKFVFHIYQACVDTFPDMPPAHLTRLMYLATFSGYNGNLIGDNRKALTKSIIQKKMGLSKPVFYKFWDDMVSRGILVDEGVSVYLNKDIFFKGQMTNQMIASYQKSNSTVTRIYIKGIRELYEKATVSSHATLSYLFRVLPFVNHQHNIVSLTVTGGDVTISYGSETANATHGQDGGSSSSEPDNKVKLGIHGKPGTATGGNLINMPGKHGSPCERLEGNKATIVRGGETVYEKHISRGGYAQSTRQEGDMVPADRGTTAYIAVLKGNDLSNEALNFTAKASKTIADLPSKSKVKLGRYGDADLQWLVSRNAENKLILLMCDKEVIEV